ncbi:PepSY domain-containing protein [Citreimonas sp.]|uniref:PepSY domain-containing protein n=1 Tax=Citreimonas sp. TaxID=3036715 RepID=UPI0035C7F73C
MRHSLPLIMAAAALAAGPALAQDAPETVGMARAIEAAQGSVAGGVLEAELETEGGIRVYEIDIVQGGDVYEVSVDAQSGEVVSQSEQRLDSFVSGIFQDEELQAAEAASGMLVEALTGLEQDGARIEELELDDEDDRWVYEIEMDGGGEYHLDTGTGELVED